MKNEDSFTLEELWQDINKPIGVHIDGKKIAQEISNEMKTELDKLREMPIEVGDIIRFKNPQQRNDCISFGLVREIYKIQDSCIKEEIDKVIYLVKIINGGKEMMSGFDFFDRDIIDVYSIKS